MTDPISDMLTRIRNASRALKPDAMVSHSNMKQSIASILKREGYIADYAVSGDKIKNIKIQLKYEGRKGVIEGLRRISTPGRRCYAAAGEMPRVLGGLGIAIVSTSQGVMTGAQARRKNAGGEVICYVW